jgi:hypothetical protein
MMTRDRLEQSARVLEQIDRRRDEAGDPTVASGLVHLLLKLEFRELEADILADPGALESQLVRLRARLKRPTEIRSRAFGFRPVLATPLNSKTAILSPKGVDTNASGPLFPSRPLRLFFPRPLAL